MYVLSFSDYILLAGRINNSLNSPNKVNSKCKATQYNDATDEY